VCSLKKITGTETKTGTYLKFDLEKLFLWAWYWSNIKHELNREKLKHFKAQPISENGLRLHQEHIVLQQTMILIAVCVCARIQSLKAIYKWLNSWNLTLKWSTWPRHV